MPPEWLPQQDQHDVALSLVLPAFRAAETLAEQLPRLCRYLDDLHVSYEILVCDDGSDDGGATRRVADREGALYVGHERNLGKGAALRSGMLAARGAYRVFTDADIPYEPETIEQMLYYLAFKEFDVVIGDRTLPGSRYYLDVEPLRRAASHVYAFLTGRIITGGLFDTQCGIKGFSAAAARDLFGVARIDRFAIDVEVLYIALKRNYDIKRLPVRLRNQSSSSVRVLRDGVDMMRDLARIRLNYWLGRYDARPDPR